MIAIVVSGGIIVYKIAFDSINIALGGAFNC
jgi:hypothetical protein